MHGKEISEKKLAALSYSFKKITQNKMNRELFFKYEFNLPKS